MKKGNGSPTSRSLKKIADLFNVTTDYLFGRNQTPKRALKDEVIELDKILDSEVGMSYGNEGEISEEDRAQIDDLIASYFWRKKQKEKRENHK